MSDRDLLGDGPVTTEEVQAAQRLAEALAGSGTRGVEPELAVARFIEASSPAGAGDEIAARRLRNELAARAPRRSRFRAARRILPIAATVAGVAFASLVFRQFPARPSERSLIARQQAARAAVVAVASMWNGEEAATSRLAAVSEQQWRSRFTTMIEDARFEELATESARQAVAGREKSAPRANLATPTPGGAS